MKMNKKGFLARHWIVAFVLFSAVIGLGFLAVKGISNQYGKNEIINENFDDSYNKFEDVSDKVNRMREETTNSSGLSFISGLDVVFTSTAGVIQLTFSTLTLPSEMLNQLVIDMGAPKVVGDILYALPLIIITTMIVYIIVSYVGRGKL